MQNSQAKIAYWAIAVLLICSRFFHFGQELDLPHDWRQADTAYYIWDFHQNGIDLLEPAVCWMGGFEHLALEFPLPEAIVAQAYRWFGPSMILSRGIFLLFFLVSVFYFHKCIKLVYNEEIAWFSSLIYLAAPLSLFYSRAIHIDFFALSFSFAMFYYCLSAIKDKSLLLLLISSILAIPAFLVKVPYAFYLAFPILAYAWQERKVAWLISRGLLFGLPLAVFWFWQQHVYSINSAAPDWEYILHYRKFDNNSAWYFGSLQQRLSLYTWKVISFRLIFEVAGGIGALFAVYGFSKLLSHPKRYFALSWAAGLMLYVLIFFNLNVFHNYYQIPFIAIAALFAGFGLTALSQTNRNRAYLGLGLIVAGSFYYAETHYYQVPEELVEIGKVIESETPEDALVVVVYKDFDCRNPRILYRAKRRGWSLETKAAKPEVLRRLYEEEGATHLIVVEGRTINGQLSEGLPLEEDTRSIPLVHSQADVIISNLKSRQ